MSSVSFTVNGRTYHPPPRPVVVLCIAGCADEDLSVSLDRGRVPYVAQMIVRGHRGLCRGAMPSFTNVSNACIVTGVPPSITGISGNFFLDPQTGEEVMMSSAGYLRCETILAAAAGAGRKAATVTAKEKLRDLLSHNLRGIAFSAEKAGQAREATHGIANVETLVGEPTPSIYSAEASLFVLRAGVALAERGLADFLYLTTTDYIQHKFPPEAPESLDFYEAIDTEVGRLLELGVVIGVTADHGMNDKNDASGRPNVIYLESLLAKRLGQGIKVICPITDPYVLHHGALGSLVMVHLADASRATEVGRWVAELDGVAEVYERQDAAEELELPADRIGDLVVLADRGVVLGRTPKDHDLSLLEGGLRSHGGRFEATVPMLLSEPLTDDYAAKAAGDPRNFDVFDLVCNGALL